MKKNKITTFKGYGRLTGPAKDGVHSVDVKLADGKAQTVKAKKVVLATGSDARMLPGYTAGRHHPDQLRDPQDRRRCRSRWWSSARARWASSSPPSSRASAPRSPSSRCCRASCNVEDEEISQGAPAPLQEARHRCEPLHQGRQDREEQGRRARQLRPTPTASRRPSRRRRCWSPWAARRAPTTSASTRPTSSPTAALS